MKMHKGVNHGGIRLRSRMRREPGTSAGEVVLAAWTFSRRPGTLGAGRNRVQTNGRLALRAGIV